MECFPRSASSSASAQMRSTVGEAAQSTVSENDHDDIRTGSDFHHCDGYETFHAKAVVADDLQGYARPLSTCGGQGQNAAAAHHIMCHDNPRVGFGATIPQGR
jgi:hypothetical protein